MESWSEYRAKAVKEFKIPPAYFDLALKKGSLIPVRSVSPEYRYLEIQSKFELSARDAARVYPDGTIDGLYESLAGVIESLKRDDTEMVLFFASRLRPESKEVLVKKIKSGELQSEIFGKYAQFRFSAYLALLKELRLSRYGPKVERWQLDALEGIVPEDEEKKTDMLKYFISQGSEDALSLAREKGALSDEDVFISALRSGNLKMLNSVMGLRRKIGFPVVGRRVQDVVKPLPFSAQGVYDIGPQGKNKIEAKYYAAAIYSGNPLFVDYIEKLGPYTGSYGKLQNAFESGMKEKINPVGYYEIYQRFFTIRAYSWVAFTDIDILLLEASVHSANQEELYYYAQEVLEDNPGIINVLFTFVEILSTLSITNKLGFPEPNLVGYPLSRRIIQEMTSS
ncbi:Hypothetical protein ZAZAV_35 [Cedratvirus Zaza IHUMI]|uniref:Uncharacterized protein n=1 Tax=Cedratvirus Zaza IHUMI TaxID=2126979 RepID=A0A2R8FCV8_9VIRU|nr:Hypothetical protein ZAZAV_35 [Cedratvirus Zaza IHUMI]